jgi:DNA-binding Lrp family transcriptional regulator
MNANTAKRHYAACLAIARDRQATPAARYDAVQAGRAVVYTGLPGGNWGEKTERAYIDLDMAVEDMRVDDYLITPEGAELLNLSMHDATQDQLDEALAAAKRFASSTFVMPTIATTEETTVTTTAINAREYAALDAVAQGFALTTEEVADELNVKRDAAYRTLRKLEALGAIACDAQESEDGSRERGARVGRQNVWQTWEDMQGATAADLAAYLAERNLTAPATTTTSEEDTMTETTTTDTQAIAETLAEAVPAEDTPAAVKTRQASNRRKEAAKPAPKKAPAKKAPAAPAAPIETAEARAQKVADATELSGISVEARQNGTRHVLVLKDAAGSRVLAYCDALKRGEGFRLHVLDYGSERRMTVKSVAEAAKQVKTSARITPKVTKAAAKPAAKKATGRKPAAKKAPAKRAASKTTAKPAATPAVAE